MAYPKLQEPGQIGSVKIKNRLIRGGSNQGFPEKYADGYLASYYQDFYEGMAKGGVGMVSTGGSPLGPPQGPPGFRLDDDKYIPSLKEFVDKMHAQDCPVFMQTFHLGPWMPVESPFTAAASTIPEIEMATTMQTQANAHSLTVEEIKGIITETGNRIERIYKAGFDGVEINAGCTHLYTHFLSKIWNRREDEYGYATMENRARIVVEIIKEIRSRTSPDFAILVLYNGVEAGVVNGITLEEGKEFAKIFEAAGADALMPRVEFYNHQVYDNKNEPTHFPDVVLYPAVSDVAKKSGIDAGSHGSNAWLPIQKAIKKVVNIPIIAVGRMTPEYGEAAVAAGEVDFVSMTRNLIADHDYVNKLFAGQEEDIAPCTHCMTCFNLGEQGKPVTCRMNPATFKEAEYEIKAAATPKKVVVVGGGPAGLETARVAALQGHKVTLLEKAKTLGGLMGPYSVLLGDCKENLQSMVKYYEVQLKKLGVDVKLGTEATKESVAALGADVLVVAAGGAENLPEVAGVDGANVLTSGKLFGLLQNYLEDTGSAIMETLDKKYAPVGDSVVIIGGDVEGVRTAEFLVKRGIKASIVEAGETIGEGIPMNLVRPQVLDWLFRNDVATATGATVKEITAGGLVYTDKDGQDQTIEAATVITALPVKADDTLYSALKDAAPAVYNIGDGSKPGLIEDAVAAGAKLGREI
jgi:2,4-dienoyl-CoA reductase (NADPH2)